MEKLKQKPLSSMESAKTVLWVGEDFWKRCSLSLEWKRVGGMDESGGNGAGRPR